MTALYNAYMQYVTNEHTNTQTVRWFVTAQAQTGLVVTRIKNKFLLPESEVQDGQFKYVCACV